MSNIKAVLISQFPLPYSKIGSWTRMYSYYLNDENHAFDFIICPEVEEKAKNTTYQLLRDVTVIDKVKNKFVDKTSRFNNFIEALDIIIKEGEKYILHIIDNSGVVLPINTYLKEKHKRDNFYIQYAYHGFEPIVSRKDSNHFFGAIDEMIFLTKLAYVEFKNYYSECTFKARFIHNGVNSKLFKRISLDEKQTLRYDLGFNENQTLFLWCSQDRPKKGLQIVLEAFSKVYKEDKNTLLLIVGIDREINQEGVRVIGRVPNNDLPKYYQTSDVYLFPSLWKEGFGIVLAEALKCGCYCIASNQGGISEVLNNGAYGVLIDNPNFIDEWVNEMKKAIKVLKREGTNPFTNSISNSIYDIDDWCTSISLAINEAKVSLNLNNND